MASAGEFLHNLPADAIRRAGEGEVSQFPVRHSPPVIRSSGRPAST
jgi:hypothetical protein